MIPASCQKTEPDPILTIDVTYIDMPNLNATGTVNVTSNGKWSVTSQQSWIQVTPASGNGDGSFTINAENNNTTSSRAGTVTVQYKNLTKNITVNQTLSQLSVINSELSFGKEQSSQTISIQSNTQWQIEIPTSATWITASPMSGTGNSQVTVTVQQNTLESPRNATVQVKYASTQMPVTVTQKSSVNHAPTTPLLSAPANGVSGVLTVPNFTWQSSTDSDGDAITYTLSYSKDNVSWKDTVISVNNFYFSVNFSPNTTYYWKVKASDGENNVVSAVNTFTTGSKSHYDNAEYTTVLTNSEGNSPCEILFLGDGYSSPELAYGGLFDQDVAAGVEAFFSVEPYKTYKNYFKVYKMATYSNESGVTQQDKSITKSTFFASYFAGGSSVSTNYDKVFEYAQKVSGITAEKLKTMLIILMLNQDRYAGTCFMWSDGRAIAICPVSRTATVSTQKFGAIVNHEAGGHGWGGFADEYVSSANTGKTIPSSDVSQYQSWANLGFYANVDVTGSTTAVKWKYFIGVSGYERVSAYEGALYYTYGAWRAENTSCMINNIPYYNAPGREAIVKKIMRVSGGTYSQDNFILNDIQKTPNTEALLMTKSFNPLTFVPLAPPVMMKN